MSRFSRPLVALPALVVFAACTPAPPPKTSSTPVVVVRDPEVLTGAYLDSVRHVPSRLIPFLDDMPKGGDLHSHLGGAVYAESLIRWAAADGLCLVRSELTLRRPPCRRSAGQYPAREITLNSKLYGDVIDSWSIRNWNPARRSGHDQFFETFDKFGAATAGRTGDMLAEVVTRASEQHVSYLELMHRPDDGSVIAISMPLRLDMNFGAMRNRLIARGLRDTLQSARRKLDAAERRERQILGCRVSPPPAPCDVTVRYLYQVLRGLPPQAVFGQILAGFEMARMDPRMVGFNLVMPEDDPIPMRDFELHMLMIDFLSKLYPDVKISLHAGELAPGLVPPEEMGFHITQSIDVGHAKRIGHGTAVLYERQPVALLKKMAARRILVEIGLSSSDAILGIRGKAHPIGAYLAAGVPVALATDDEGVLRSNMTREFRRAVEEQNLSYRTLKMLARNSLVYAFVDDGTKVRLLNQLDSAFTQFERSHAVASPH